MRRKRKAWDAGSEPDQEINMTPMIDCVFQLLIFFMVGTRFRSDDGVLSANLPRNKGQRAVPTVLDEKDLPHVRIRLSLGGGVASGNTVCRVNNAVVPFNTATRIDPRGDGLKAHLTGLRRMLGDQKVTIDGEFQVPTKDVVCALNAALAVGYKEINFTVPDFIKRGGALPPR